MKLLRIGTRKSPLALTQAGMVRDRLAALYPGLAIEIVTFTTSGDKLTDRPLSEAGGKGLFTKELEEALFANQIDIAVHSMKDMQTVLPPGLIIACMFQREDPADMLVGEGIASLADIPKGVMFGTSSLRRSAQLLMIRPDLKIVPLRGNVETRLAKLKRGEAAATMLAVAGLKRLGVINPLPLREGAEGGDMTKLPPTLTLPLKGGGNISGVKLSPDEFLPAPAQGAIGIECRMADVKILEMLRPLSHVDTEVAVTCEREFLRVMDGSCRTPIGGLAEIKNNTLHFRGLIIKPDGRAHHAVSVSGSVVDAVGLGKNAGEDLLRRCGRNFLG